MECPSDPSVGVEGNSHTTQSRNPEPLPSGRNQAVRENEIRTSIQEPAKSSPHSLPKNSLEIEKIARC